MAAKVREVLARLKGDGWALDRVKGSHHIFRHPIRSGSVTVAYDREGDEIPVGTLRSIEKQAGWR